MKKKIILGLLAIIIFLDIMISLVFATNASIDVINLDCNGAVISVKSDEKINRVIMYKKDSQGNYVRFFENMETGYNEKNFFISRYSLSETDKSNFRVDVITESGRSSTVDVKVDKVPELPEKKEEIVPTPTTKPTASPTTTPSVSPSTTPNPSNSNNNDTKPTSIILNQNNLTLTIGEKKQAQLKLTMQPSNAKAKLTWSSDDKSIATVNKNGIVNGKKTGTTTIKVKTDTGLVAQCKVTVKLKKINKTISKRDASLCKVIDTANGCTSMQSVAVTDKYYVCVKRRNDDKLGTVLVYDKKTNKRVNVLTGKFGHANGVTYNTNDKCIYITHMGGNNVSRISEKNLTAGSLKRTIMKFPTTPTGLGYDDDAQQWVLKNGKHIYVYNNSMTKRIRSFEVAKHIGQECEVYKNLLLSVDYIGNSNAYVYVYNINNGICYGKYKITMPIELEGVSYDKDSDSLILTFNDNEGDKLYKIPANLKNYI